MGTPVVNKLAAGLLEFAPDVAELVITVVRLLVDAGVEVVDHADEIEHGQSDRILHGLAIRGR